MLCSPLTDTRLPEMSSQRPLKIRTLDRPASVRTQSRGNYYLVIVDTITPTEARISIPFAQRHVVAPPLKRHFNLVSINTKDKLTHNRCAVENNYTGLFESPSRISELNCATTKTDTAERSISIGRESLQVFFLY